MHCIGLKLSGILEEFSITLRFWGSKNCKNQLFEENKRFECRFYRIQVQVIANLLSRLEKHQTLDILLVTDFFMNFKKLIIFRILRNFGNHRLHILKSLCVFYFKLIC